MTYKPQPIDTTKICLSDDILALSELLAKNSHEVWAAERINQGWTYGSARDDTQKHHPCLIPYEELAESEKVYDRCLTMETLKVILSLGYKIQNAKNINS